jgi:hypothetical protein
VAGGERASAGRAGEAQPAGVMGVDLHPGTRPAEGAAPQQLSPPEPRATTAGGGCASLPKPGREDVAAEPQPRPAGSANGSGGGARQQSPEASGQRPVQAAADAAIPGGAAPADDLGGQGANRGSRFKPQAPAGAFGKRARPASGGGGGGVVSLLFTSMVAGDEDDDEDEDEGGEA